MVQTSWGDRQVSLPQRPWASGPSQSQWSISSSWHFLISDVSHTLTSWPVALGLQGKVVDVSTWPHKFSENSCSSFTLSSGYCVLTSVLDWALASWKRSWATHWAELRSISLLAGNIRHAGVTVSQHVPSTFSLWPHVYFVTLRLLICGATSKYEIINLITFYMS